MMNAKLFRPRQYFLNPVSNIISILLLLLYIPIHRAQNYIDEYNDCKEMTTHACGKPIKGGLEYPFWGDHDIRPSYCGLKEFELSCEEDDLVVDIGSDSKYRVVEVNPSSSGLILHRNDDSLEDICASTLTSSTILDETLYDYGDNTEEIHLFYQCGPAADPTGITFKLPCSSGDKKEVYFIPNNDLPKYRQSLGSCKYATLPVNMSVLDEIIHNKRQLAELLMGDIKVRYNSINKNACIDCVKTDGLCWNGTSTEEDNTCLYSNGTVLPPYPTVPPPYPTVPPPYPTVPPPYPQPGNKMKLGLKIGIASGVVGCSILLLLVLITYCHRKKNKYISFLFPQDAPSYSKDIEAFITQYGSSIPKRYKYSTLKKITNSFEEELGKGGYGNVYKGRLADGRVVAVKVLYATKGNGEEFINEVASIGRTSHVNVVTLLGFCYEGKRRALLYEFMSNGSLEKFIHLTTPLLEAHLKWEKLFSIAIEIAQGLEYLHRGCNTRILHFDIKPHNILLDKDFRPKISDFGLAKLYTTEDSAVSSLLQARGTIGYIAPEVACRNFGQVSHKSDVYSYGMMILEMVGGRKNVNARADHTSEIYYPRWLYKRIQCDDVLNLANEISEEENELVRKMVIVGLWCIQTYPSQRPSITKVIEMLKGQTAALEIPPNPYLCSLPTSPSNSQTKLELCPPSGTESITST
ncbi:LEAF RUST 10 DISEASE-RESISTANCE LOCUS RECEPTOR-LIKE PROTEIN KINASE-like 2.4 [Apium graveolens]|uniref:LEAF RUST 10 DISEASE-RESISTANCE LOCUS RECEPTOR-LIKE PROTEIN KINASE-like 2.4 n=1 Tax=Apium graveolens TaxID=4045 RepID=UPI003D7A7ED0